MTQVAALTAHGRLLGGRWKVIPAHFESDGYLRPQKYYGQALFGILKFKISYLRYRVLFPAAGGVRESFGKVC